MSNVKHLLLRKTHVLKSSIFSKRKFEEMHTSFEEQQGTTYIREKGYFSFIVFSYLSSTKPCVRFL